ncbi:alpha/beta fold hydrolase [Mesorhizobium sp. CAU 1741]|uniref:alpha/beta hydrolase n=1 Tax=Mesorhizobium sp. CAU 1741 TaxID=3140366 RepID=UPI00325B52E4
MVKIVLFSALVAAGIYLSVALALVASQEIDTSVESGGAIDFSYALNADNDDLAALLPYPTRAGDSQFYRYYPSDDAGVRFILVHGSAWHSMQFHEMARSLSEAGVAEVVVPDVRGHGPNTRLRGDIAYIGQLEDDMADLMVHLSAEYGTRPTVLGGHSSGGGFAIRFAAGRHTDLADGFVFLAPYLQHDAPTTRPNSGGWARPAVRRIIGLTMLNTIGITALNHLPVIAFAMPAFVLEGPLGDTATTSYSYRLNTSFAPRADFESEIAAIPARFLVVAGSTDEAFDAALYEPVMSAVNDRGTYRIIDGAGHIDLLGDRRVVEAISVWLSNQDLL